MTTAREKEIASLVARYGLHKNGHSHFAPSASAGWLNCSGFLLANIEASDSAGMEAAYGTVAHHVAERWQKMGKKPIKLLGRKETAHAGGNIYEFVIDDKMMALVEQYIEWCDEVPGVHFYEQKVKFGDLMPIPDQGGTADHFAIYYDEDEGGWVLVITDFKTGSGVRVYAEGNTQAQLYALGVFRDHDWEYGFVKVIIRICQPPLNVFETWERTRQDILDFEEFTRTRADIAWAVGAARTPSKKACQWCRVSERCPANLKQLDHLLDATFGFEPGDEIDVIEQESNIAYVGSKDYLSTEVTSKLIKLPGFNAAAINNPEWKHLSTTTLSYVLTFRRRMEKLFAAIATELLRRAENGEKLPFQQLENGRSTRSWTDADNASTYLIDEGGLTEEQVHPPGMVSVAEAEKLLHVALKISAKVAGKALEEVGLVKRMAGKRTLGDPDEGRPDINDLLDETFEAEDADEL